MKGRQDPCVVLQPPGSGSSRGNAKFRWWIWACWESRCSTAISIPLGVCCGCHTSVTSVVCGWRSIFSSVEPHLVAFLRHFLCPCSPLSGFFSSCASQLRAGRKDKTLEKGQGSQSCLCFSRSSLSLGVIRRSRGSPGLRPSLLLSPAVQSRPSGRE